MPNRVETFLKETEESIVDHYEAKNITFGELLLHYRYVYAAIQEIFMENEKSIPAETVIPFDREKCKYLESIIKKMWELKYKGPNMIRPQDVAYDFYKDDFSWSDYKEIPGIDDVKSFVRYFKDNYLKYGSDAPAGIFREL